MLITEGSLGTVEGPEFAGLERDYLAIDWFNAHKRIGRENTRRGTDLGIRLDDEAARRGWRSGDVAWADEKTAIVIDILPCACIAVREEDPVALVRLGYEAGNRHAPLFHGDLPGEFLMPYDEPLRVLLEKSGFSPVKEERRLLPEKRLSSAAGHGHGHGQDHHHD